MIKHPARLIGVDPRLVAVVEAVAARRPVTVIEGLRTPTRQAELYAIGRNGDKRQKVTWSMNSKHLTGNAVDIAPHPLNWDDRAGFMALAKLMHEEAAKAGVKLRHGGDWDMDGITQERGESDLPHFEILD